MPNRQEQHHRSPRDVPPVGRPKGAVWRSLQADGVVWEGQVLLVGGDVDLAARMIVTHRRVVFVRGGDIVLEIPRGWLRQEPVLRRDGVLEIFVATPDSNPFDEPMPVQLRMREGHPAAGHIIAMLAPGGVRRIAPDAMSAIERARDAAPTPTYGGFWDGVDPIPTPKRDELSAATRHLAAENGYEGTPEDLPPIEPPDRLVRVPSSPRRQPNVPAYTIAGLAPRDQRRSPLSLVLRICALLLLLGTAAALGAGRLNIAFPGSSPSAEAVLTGPPAEAEPEAQPVASSEPETAPDSASTTLSPADLTAVAVGVGGPAVQPNQDSTVAQAPSEPLVTATAALAVAPTEAAIPTPAPAVEDPVQAEAQESVSAPEASVAAPEESAAAPEAVESDAAPEQSRAPDQSPAASAATQPAAVPENGMPAQEIVVGAVRMAIPTALRAESLPKYGLPPGDGEWVLLVTDLTNEGDTATTLAMSDFRLFDRGIGRVADLDSGVGVIATLAGMATSRDASETISLDPGASTKALLLYLLPPGSSEDLALLVGESALDLAPSLAASEGEPAARPELLEATVTQVHGGDRITVDIDGLSRVVRYLGIRAPAADACFAAESTAANSQLVEGKTIWLERQATDIGADGELMRDVWVADAQGERVLVGARLLEAGAAEAHSVAPDTRYQSWLSASSTLGRTNGAGLWGHCPDAGTSVEPAAST